MKSRNDRAATFGNGRSHPPKNSVVTTDDTTIMFAYSARKNSANRMPLYSVWKPPVSSCSASGRSKGARLVSASPPISTRTNASGCAKTYQTCWLYCALTMPTMLSVPATRITLTSVSVTATSYEMNCADARRLASSGYLLFEAQPARMMPYTPTDATETTYSRPTLMSVMYSGTGWPNIVTV